MMTDLLTELQCTKPPNTNCYRLFILGTSKVGKSAIVRRFLSDDFTESHIPTIEEFHRKLYKIRNEVYQLDIVDTSGMNPFPAMRRLSFLTGDAFILVYSIDSRESFEEVLRLREQILESIRAAVAGNKGKSNKVASKNTPHVPMIIAGNKCDKTGQSRVVATVEVEHMLQRFKADNVAFVECSAKENRNIADLFEMLFVLADFPDEMIPNAERRISLTHGGNVLFNHRRTKSPASSWGLSKNSNKKHQLLDHERHQGDCSNNNNHNNKMNHAPTRHGITLRRRLSDAYSALITNVRRPSVKADLTMVQEKRDHPCTPRPKHRKKKTSIGRRPSRILKYRDMDGSQSEMNQDGRDFGTKSSWFKECWRH